MWTAEEDEFLIPVKAINLDVVVSHGAADSELWTKAGVDKFGVNFLPRDQLASRE